MFSAFEWELLEQEKGKVTGRRGERREGEGREMRIIHIGGSEYGWYVCNEVFVLWCRLRVDHRS